MIDWKLGTRNTLSELCRISVDWCKLVIPDSTQMSLVKCYWMLQNAMVTGCTVSELLKENQQWGNYILLHSAIKYWWLMKQEINQVLFVIPKALRFLNLGL